uniref:Mitogen-activated protein kinase kinase kinase N-terminal domain-containing protein n=1 Tax=Timema bartmani TaxID=61472 RepID=A0A7R9F3R9_9NEOP|nr:unnamed protein product [Timema bartmani]
MSDEDWKRRIGITINYSPDSSEDDITLQFRDEYKDEVLKNQLSPLAVDNVQASSQGGNNFMDVDDIFDFYEDFGQTPPRTRLSRRQKERNQRVKESCEINNRPAKLIDGKKKCKTLDNCLYFNELLEKADSNAQQPQDNDQQSRVESTRREKRSRKLLRGFERDMKLDLSGVSQTPILIEDDRAESMPLANQQQMKVETFNRFLSLSSKPVNSCREFKDKCKDKDKYDRCKESVDFLQDRVDFHKTFSLLIRMGSGDNKTDKNTRRHLSREEDVWQNELKDLIWLELQAWQADRTPREQDDYLCKAREKVADLLDEIINYRFERRPLCNLNQSVLSTQQSDSGISGGGDSPEMPLRTVHTGEVALGADKLCPGCVSMFCQNCLDTQNIALREVEQLLNRLEAAEQLYSSSKAFGQFYPLYASHKFSVRVKTMCVWYNMMKHHRLRLKIIGKMLMFMENTNHKDYNWPPIDEDDPNSSGMGTDISDDHYLDTHSVSRSTSIEGQAQSLLYSQSKNQAIQFADCQGNPSDSNNSNISSNNSSDLGIDTLMDIYDMSQITHLRESIFPKNTSSPAQRYPYRKYMEHVLKTRGLKTSVNFLERLHKKVLQKAQVTFEKPTDLDSIPSEDKEATITTVDDTYVGDEDCEDLRRYGYWSKEYKALNLPSYLGAYLFLCSVPLELTHEYIIMRLEQKPDQPSVLSIRQSSDKVSTLLMNVTLFQLMREFQEGISLSIFFKQRYVRLVDTVLGDIDDQHFLDGHKISLINFDKSVKTLLEVYLEYLQQWIQMAPRAIVDKNFLEDEWTWLRSCSPLIPGTEGLIAHKFW